MTDSNTEKTALDTLIAKYRKAQQVEKLTNWEKGALASMIFEELKKNKRSGVLKRFLNLTKESRSTLYQYSWVYNKFKDSPNRELPGISWSIYRAAAGTENPDKWVQLAYDNGWTYAQLIQALEDEKVEKTISSGYTCIICGGEVPKEDKLIISYRRKKYILCGKDCAEKWVNQMGQEQTEQ
jgi:hypothetical protein